MRVSESGLALIKEFEGLRLESYYCASSVLTVGWGHTGPDVYEGQSITLAQAESLLRDDLERFVFAVEDSIEVPLTQEQFDSIVSFAFNCGTGALVQSTLRARLNAGEPVCLVIREELPKWVKGSNGPLEGLVRRRDAEVKHACGEQLSTPEQPMDDFILNAVKYYKGLPHQDLAFLGLWSDLSAADRDAFVSVYRNELQEPEKDILVFPLDVPYYNQNDSATSHGHRMCFSSSMTMALDYIDPDKIEGDDDWYLGVVFKYGDTVSAEAQMAAAHSLGFEAEMHYDGTQARLEELLDQGVPCPIGILHHGSVDSPSGGGHWICLTGHNDTHFFVNDPAGDLDLINGGYHTWDSGEQLLYSKENLMKRWLISSDHDGWFMDLSGNF